MRRWPTSSTATGASGTRAARPSRAGERVGADARRAAALRDPGAPRDAPALGPAARARRRRSSRSRSPTGCRRRPATTGSPSTPRTTRSSTSSSTARSPRAVRRRLDDDLGPRHLRGRSSGTTRKIEVRAARRAPAEGRYALFPLQPGEPTGKDWMIHRMDPPADPDREPMPDRIVPMLARSATLPRGRRRAGPTRSSGTACARSRYSEPGRLRLRVAQPAATSPTRYPELAPAEPRAQPPQRDARRRDRRVRRGRAGRASAGCSGGCTSASRGAAKRLLAGGRRSPTSSSTCCGSTATRSWTCPTRSGARGWRELELQGRALADARARRRRRRGAAGGDRAQQGLEGVIAKRLDCALRAGPALDVLDQDQERRSASDFVDRRLAAGGGAAARAHRRAARRGRGGRPPALRRAASAPASPRPSSTGSPSCSTPLERDDVAVRPTGPKPPRGAVLGRAAPRRRGRVRRVDARTAMLRAPVLQGPARGRAARSRSSRTGGPSAARSR